MDRQRTITAANDHHVERNTAVHGRQAVGLEQQHRALVFAQRVEHAAEVLGAPQVDPLAR
jgi:hypothetical protein